MVRDLAELGPNLQKIITRLQADQNLLKLLYYTDKDPLSQMDLTPTQIKEEVFDTLIKIVPRISPTETAKSIIAMRVISGDANDKNDEFRDIIINFEVFVPLTQWVIKDANLRPFCIMGRILKDLRGKTIDGLGKFTGGNFTLNFLTEEMSCYEMTFSITTYD
jgi:hypothetical protein